MKKGILGSFAILFMVSACYSHSVLRKKDYIEKSDEEVRAIFLEFAPPGSKEDYVKKVMRDKFRLLLVKKFVYQTESDTRQESMFPGTKEEVGDYVLTATLASYSWGRKFFLAGKIVSASWLFAGNGTLKDVRVSHHSDNV